MQLSLQAHVFYWLVKRLGVTALRCLAMEVHKSCMQQQVKSGVPCLTCMCGDAQHGMLMQVVSVGCAAQSSLSSHYRLVPCATCKQT